MDTSGELSKFLEKWRAAFKTFRTAYWEGREAHRELERAGLLPRVLCEEKSNYGSGLEHPIAEHAIEAFCGELHFYRDRVGKIRETIDRENDYSEELGKYARNLRARAERCKSRSPEHSKRLARLAANLETEERRLLYEKEQRWRYPRSVAIEELLTRRAPVQERELDGWLQNRLGIHVRTSLPIESGVSLRTIARLVVLFLVCADVAVVQDDTVVKLVHSGEEVSVSSVLRMLRRTNIDRLPQGKRRRPQAGKT
jgi:hypothetical protein